MSSQYTAEPTYRKIPQRNNLFEGQFSLEIQKTCRKMCAGVAINK